MENIILKNMARHNIGLSDFACNDDKAIRLKYEVQDLRSPFFHDIDRIIYSYAYMRYSDKTQVFSKKNNDHITRRMLHAQYVSKIARTIGRALALNEDLIEAASLGHDLGHVPFGHFGESVLNELSLEYGEGYFHHNIQSVRILMFLENKGYGKNLTLQVLDAIMCHNGEFLDGEYRPVSKTFESFLDEYNKSYTDEDVIKRLRPMTLEGCVVRISDIIAYLGKDIEDAAILGLFDKTNIPDEITNVLGSKHREVVNTIINDIIKNSLSKPYIKLSDEVFKAMVELKKFNYQNIYNSSLSDSDKENIRQMFFKLFHVFLDDVKNKRMDSKIYVDFLNHKCSDYFNNTSDHRKVIDYLAGMTDDYFLECYECKIHENRV